MIVILAVNSKLRGARSPRGAGPDPPPAPSAGDVVAPFHLGQEAAEAAEMRPVDHAVVSQHIRGANMACSNPPVSGESLPAAAPRSTLPQPRLKCEGESGESAVLALLPPPALKLG